MDKLLTTNFTYIEMLKQLKEKKRWTVWKGEWIESKQHWNKPPYNANMLNYFAKSNDSSTWATYEEVKLVVEQGKVDGLNYCCGNGIVGVDIDDCFNVDGTLKDYAKAIVEQLDSYTEKSPSGKGLHIFVESNFDKNLHQDEVELKAKNLFLTVTGEVYGEFKNIEKRDKEIEEIYSQYTPKFEIKNNFKPTYEKSDLSTQQIIDFITNRGNGKNSWYGNYSTKVGSESEADMSLVMQIVFYTQDRSQIQEVFERSPLFAQKTREALQKYQRLNYYYINMTIDKALMQVKARYRGKNDKTSSTKNILCINSIFGKPAKMVIKQDDKEVATYTSKETDSTSGLIDCLKQVALLNDNKKYCLMSNIELQSPEIKKRITELPFIFKTNLVLEKKNGDAQAQENDSKDIKDNRVIYINKIEQSINPANIGKLGIYVIKNNEKEFLKMTENKDTFCEIKEMLDDYYKIYEQAPTTDKVRVISNINFTEEQKSELTKNFSFLDINTIKRSEKIERKQSDSQKNERQQ